MGSGSRSQESLAPFRGDLFHRRRERVDLLERRVDVRRDATPSNSACMIGVAMMRHRSHKRATIFGVGTPIDLTVPIAQDCAGSRLV